MKNHKIIVLSVMVAGMIIGINLAGMINQKQLQRSIDNEITTPNVLQWRIEKERRLEKVKASEKKKSIEQRSEQQRLEESTIIKQSLLSSKSRL